MSRCLALLLIFLVHTAYSQVFQLSSLSSPATEGDSRGVIFVDLNQDGLDDLYIVNGPKGGQQNVFYENINGQFQLKQNGLTTVSSATVGASFADVDNDGDLDGFLANWYNEQNIFLENIDGDWIPKDIEGFISHGNSESATWGDLNNDGLLDIAIANGSLASGQPNKMFLQNLPLQFSEVTNIFTQMNVNTRSLNWVDADGDGDLDLFTGEENKSNGLFLNNNGELRIDTLSEFNNSSDVTFGSSLDDIDNDGDLDLIVCNWGSASIIYKNRGDGVFEEWQKIEGPGAIGSTFGDFDNDGDLDLVLVRGFIPTSVQGLKNSLLINDGNGEFTENKFDVVSQSNAVSYGVAHADYNNDGYLDICIANIQGNPNLLFTNQSNGNGWIKVECEGTVSNRSAIGAKIQVKSTIGEKPYWQTRYITTQSGYTSQNSLSAHFGLEKTTRIDSLVVFWPSGITSIETDLSVNSTYRLVEPRE